MPGVPGLARQPTTRQRRRDELAMTLTLVVVGLVLAPPTGWLLGAWLADLTQGALALVLGRPGHRRQHLVELRARSRRLARPIIPRPAGNSRP